MNKKIKILNAVNRNSQDILPNQIDCTLEMKDKIKKLLNTFFWMTKLGPIKKKVYSMIFGE